METTMQWWYSLDLTQQIFWGVAILSSVFFVMQTAMTLFGLGDTDAPDMDMSGGEGATDALAADSLMDLFTLRNMVNFFLGFGWAGVSLRGLISSTSLLIVVAIIVGCLFVAFFLMIFRSLLRLEEAGNVSFADAVGSVAEVYLRIPEGGKGKVQVSINGSVHEVDATASEAIPSGTKVTLVSYDGSVYQVKR